MVQCLAQHHEGNKWQGQGLNPTLAILSQVSTRDRRTGDAQCIPLPPLLFLSPRGSGFPPWVQRRVEQVGQGGAQPSC